MAHKRDMWHIPTIEIVFTELISSYIKCQWHYHYGF